MNNKEKVECIFEAYPSERIDSNQKRLLRYWNGEISDRLPFVIRRRELPKYLPDNYSISNFTFESRLRTQLEDILNKAHIKDDYTPTIITDNNPYTLSEAFGCIGSYQQGLFISEPIVDTPEEVYALQLPDISNPKGRLRDHLEFIEYVLDVCGDSIPIHTGDIQGPMALASSIWRTENFFIALYTHPEAVHHLLGLVTEFLCRYIDHLLERVGTDNLVTVHCMPFLWRPFADGITLSEDTLPLISPELFSQFAEPYLERLADRYGSLVLHSCGDCSGAAKVLTDKEYIKGFQFSQTPIESIIPTFSRGKSLISRNDWQSIHHLKSYIDVVKEYRINALIQVQSLDVMFGPDERDLQSLFKILIDNC